MTVGVGAGRLVARTRAVQRPLDLGRRLDRARFVFWRDGQGLLCEGVAARVPIEEVADVLRGADIDGPADAPVRPVAVGALPFDPIDIRGAHLVLPARVVRVDGGGTSWITEVSPVDRGGDDAGESIDGDAWAARSPLEAGRMTRSDWFDAVRAALAAIETEDVEKVVLSRDGEVRSDRPIPTGEVVNRLTVEQPGCFVFQAGDLVGASPELLVERCGTRVWSRPMAGTVAGTESAAVSALDRSEKDRREHRLVVDAVVDALGSFTCEPPSVSGPDTVRLVGLSHFATDIEGRLKDTATSALDLALALHPTPAVAGVPTDAALALIRRLEGRPRGPYGGPVGWVDSSGDGQFAVALRCAQVDGDRAVLHAGAGIVAGSDPEREWTETAVKFGPMLAALHPGDGTGHPEEVGPELRR